MSNPENTFRQDMIPDAETALKIGRVILERYYGDSLVRRYEPYRATLDPINGENWVVSESAEKICHGT